MTYSDFYKLYYEPYATDAALQKRIADGIEQNRKGDCRVRVTDAVGKPLANTRVEIKQTAHAFRYGANIFMLDEFKEKELNVRYRDAFHRYFNLATVPFYWNTLEPERGKPRFAADSEKIYRRPAPDLCIEYCREKGIDAKLHCLVYEAYMPEWIKSLPLAEVKVAYEKRFAEIAERYADKLYEVEVINEVLCIPTWKGRTSALAHSPDLITWSWKTARKFFPNNKLVFNETVRWHRFKQYGVTDRYPLLLENALLKGVTMDKIGIQSHLFVGYKAQTPEQYEQSARELVDRGNVCEMLHALDILGQFDLPLEITEITIPTFGEGEEFEQLQADMLKLWYSAYFSHPLMETIVYWNTADGHGFSRGAEYDENRCRGGLFHKDMTPKKCALMLKHLFEEEWCTNLTAMTDADGYLSFRGFFGDYALTVGDATATLKLEKGKEGDLAVRIV